MERGRYRFKDPSRFLDNISPTLLQEDKIYETLKLKLTPLKEKHPQQISPTSSPQKAKRKLRKSMPSLFNSPKRKSEKTSAPTTTKQERNLYPGAIVNHPEYGTGIVLSKYREKVTISFSGKILTLSKGEIT